MPLKLTTKKGMWPTQKPTTWRTTAMVANFLVVLGMSAILNVQQQQEVGSSGSVSVSLITIALLGKISEHTGGERHMHCR